MSIQKEFVLRYRTVGHVRFQLPAHVCEVTIAKAITEGIFAIDGVYRVNFYRSQGKLSIRFQEFVCDFPTLAKQLFSLLSELDKQGVFNKQSTELSGFAVLKAKAKTKLDTLKSTRWLKEKIGDAQDAIQAAKIVSKLATHKSNPFAKDTEQAVINFLNDILVLFLIKLHWTHITQLWLLKPIKYRYELMAMFYMFFLLVRARKKK